MIRLLDALESPKYQVRSVLFHSVRDGIALARGDPSRGGDIDAPRGVIASGARRGRGSGWSAAAGDPEGVLEARASGAAIRLVRRNCPAAWECQKTCVT